MNPDNRNADEPDDLVTDVDTDSRFGDEIYDDVYDDEGELILGVSVFDIDTV